MFRALNSGKVFMCRGGGLWSPRTSITIMLLTAHDMMTCLDSVNLCDSGLNSGSAVHCSSIQEMAESRL